jgi:predicted RNA-binding protein with TRAM domain
MKILFLIALLASLTVASGCTNTTEIYVYDEKGLEKKIARITQEDDGIASYEVKDKYTIAVDTRYKENAGADPYIEIYKTIEENSKSK